MIVQFTKNSHTTFTLTCTRKPGDSEIITLDTKTFFKHDLMHLSVETHAKLRNSFFGLIANGKSIAELSGENAQDISNPPFPEIAVTERIVGIMQGAAESVISFESMFASAENLFHAYDTEVPSYITNEWYQAVLEQYHSTLQIWNNLQTKHDSQVQFDFP